jgi:hypothetical protein
MNLRPSVQPDGTVEVPGSADFDHVEVARQSRWERLVLRVALHDVPNLLIDFRDAAGELALRLVWRTTLG